MPTTLTRAAGDGVRLAEGHLQGREVKDRPDSVLLHHPVDRLGIGDVPLDPGHAREFFLLHQQARPAAARVEIERDGGHAGADEDRERPAPDTPAGAGHEHRSVEILFANGEAAVQRVHGFHLVMWGRLVSMPGLSHAMRIAANGASAVRACFHVLPVAIIAQLEGSACGRREDARKPVRGAET